MIMHKKSLSYFNERLFCESGDNFYPPLLELDLVGVLLTVLLGLLVLVLLKERTLLLVLFLVLLWL